MSESQAVLMPEKVRSMERTSAPADLGAPGRPISIYEVELASWMRVPEEQNRPLTGGEMAPKLAEYVKSMGFTHVQLRSPKVDDLKVVVDRLHDCEVDVIVAGDQTFKDTTGPDMRIEGKCGGGEILLSGHGFKLDWAWAEETLDYLGTDPLYRKFRHSLFGRRDSYAFSADHILPLGGELVRQPRSSLLAAMPGDDWQKFANLRLLFAYMFLLPGKKLIFMGDEFGQPNPWRPETSLDWHVINGTGFHGKLKHWVRDLNRFYRQTRALYETDSLAAGFQWVETADAESSVVSFLRRDITGREVLLAVLNFTPVTRYNYRVGVSGGGFWAETLNSDAVEFGGSGQGNLGGVEAAPFGWNFQSHSLYLTLPPLAAIVLKASK